MHPSMMSLQELGFTTTRPYNSDLLQRNRHQRFCHRRRKPLICHKRQRAPSVSLPCCLASPSGDDRSSRRPIASKLASSGLKLIIRSLCDEVQDLEVDVNAASNRDFLRGRLRGVSISSSRLRYNGIRVSGGAGLYTDALELIWGPGQPSPQLRRPLSLSATLALTSADINVSKPVRDLFHSLLTEVIRIGLSGVVGRWLPKQLGGVQYNLNRVDFTEDTRGDRANRPYQKTMDEKHSGGRLILDATAKFGSGRVINFKVQTGLVTQDSGRVVALHNPVLFWRGIPLPLLSIAFVGVKLPPEALLTSITVREGLLAAEGLIVIRPPAMPPRQIRNVTTDSLHLRGRGF